MKKQDLLTGREIADILITDAFNILKNHGREHIQEAIWVLKAAKYANSCRLSDACNIVMAVTVLQDFISDRVYKQLITYDGV